MGTIRKWSLVEIEYLRTHWGKESAWSLKNYFGCSWLAVANKAKELGLEEKQNPTWKEEEIEQLKILAREGVHYEEIASIMKKTPTAIYLKAHRLNIVVRQDKREWSSEDEEYLKEFWGDKSVGTIAKNLKRSVDAVKIKAVRMGLGSMIEKADCFWTINDIIEVIGVSRDIITRTWRKKGLKITYKKLGQKRRYMGVTFEDLLEFLKENQNLWDSRKVDSYMIGDETGWLHEKRLKDKKDSPREYKTWSKQELNHAINLFDIGKTYAEIAERIGRSETSVAAILRQSGLSFRMAKYWQENELEYLEQNYKGKTYAEIAEKLGRTEKAVSFQASRLGLIKKPRKK